tara:strand:+ start:1414 stop:1926 length:513 start_codon:yes stop_codon:yes gene_type:complete
MIEIVNDFFEKDMFEKIKHHCTTKLNFEPQYFVGTTERNKYTHYGDRYFLEDDLELFKQFSDTIEKKFKIKIIDHEYGGVDRRSLDHFKPHVDTEFGAVRNVMVMLSGPSAVSNGTVFYTEGELDIHVGFRENRAIFFPSNYVHSAHANNVPNLKRFSATVFIKKYEKVL